ncbi:nuclear transport factor 2 family protein [Chryseobacterium indologenes]|uniref:nuclear transport factor 2 family protein n=1 Tax=Chryseobacterium indologenes TaxID=253 RepID=UPI001107C3FE|nr:nuclear transport factor 2 family protein [Chryseobacterium indologenes]TLX26617.1 nuclear transport factor 2 family protein [Chryseobacterium indologenes]
MTLEILKTKEELRDLIDAYAYLGDDKKISEQMQLFTKDATYKVYMNGVLVANTTGTDVLEKEFSGHAAQVKTYFTLNGQHTVKIDGDKATGVSFTQIKMVREVDGKDNITDYSVKYEDIYVRQEGKWLINERIGHFLILEARPLNS